MTRMIGFRDYYDAGDRMDKGKEQYEDKNRGEAKDERARRNRQRWRSTLKIMMITV